MECERYIFVTKSRRKGGRHVHQDVREGEREGISKTSSPIYNVHM